MACGSEWWRRARRFSDGGGGRGCATIAAARHPGVEIVFHPQCFLAHNHFAGSDAARGRRLRRDRQRSRPSTRSGSRAAATAPAGSPRRRSPRLGPAARDKTYLGYSDAGYPARRPLPRRLSRISRTGRCRRTSMRDGGEAAVARALAWLAGRDAGGAGARARAGPRARRVQHHRLRPAARHAARARPGRPCPAARGGVRAYVPDRPGDVPHHRPARRCGGSPASGSAACSDVPDNDPRFRRERGGGGPLLVRARRHRLSRPRRHRPRFGQQGGAVRPLSDASSALYPQKSPSRGGKSGPISARHCPLPRPRICALSSVSKSTGREDMAQGRQSGLQRPVTPVGGARRDHGFGSAAAQPGRQQDLGPYQQEQSAESRRTSARSSPTTSFAPIFGKDRCSMFEMNKHLSRHLS